MGILKRLRGRIDALSAAAPQSHDSERYAFEAAIPLAGTQAPLWRIRVQMLSEPQADGEHLRLRAHIQTNFASALRPALQAQAPTERPALEQRSGSRTPGLSARAGQLVQRTAQRALNLPLVGALMEPLLKLDLNTWIEVQTSTASLDSGARDLLPQSERLAALGIRPQRVGEQALAESWAGEAPDGYAQVSVVQMDQRHLSPRLKDLLGQRPFALAATIVNTAQQK